MFYTIGNESSEPKDVVLTSYERTGEIQNLSQCLYLKHDFPVKESFFSLLILAGRNYTFFLLPGQTMPFDEVKSFANIELRKEDIITALLKIVMILKNNQK